MSALRQTSYVAILGLAFQSFRFELQMDRHLLEMANAAQKAATFETTSESDKALSTENNAKSIADNVESESLRKHSNVLKEESDRDFAAANADRVSSEEFTSKIAEEEAEAVIHETAAAAEEAIYDADTKKAVAEAAKAAQMETSTESDGLATGICEFVPGLDFLCDLIGGAAAIRMQTNAAKFTGESALDYAAATTAKEQEGENLAAAEVLHAEAAEDGEVAAQLETEADAEEKKAEEEAAEAKEEMMESEEKKKQSEEEEALSKEEQTKAETEDGASSDWWEKSIMHGLAAFWCAMLSASVSVLAFLFFAIRIYVAVLVPGAIAVADSAVTLGMLPSGRRPQTAGEFIRNSWTVLRKVSYFLLHCNVFVTAIITFFPKFETLDDMDPRSKGGIVILFSLFVATLQSFLLHALPLFARPKEVQNVSVLRRCIISIWNATCSFCRAIMYILPLIIMETLALWVLFGHGIFSPNLSQSVIPYVLGLLLAAITHIYLFERDERSLVNMERPYDNNSIVEHISASYSRSFADDRDVDDNERDPLLKAALRNQLISSYIQSKKKRISSYNDDIEIAHSNIEMCHSTDSTTGGDSVWSKNDVIRRRAHSFDNVSYGVSEVTSFTTTQQEVDKSESELESECDHDYEDNCESESLLTKETSGMSSGTTSPISNERRDTEQPTTSSTSNSCWDHWCFTTTKKYFSVLQFPFEVLILSCMIALLKSAIPSVQRLWPIFRKNFLDSHRPGFLTEMGILLFCIVIGVLVCLHQTSTRRSQNMHKGFGLFTGESLRS